MVYVLYNSTAGSHYGVDKLREKMQNFFGEEDITLASVITVDDKKEYIKKLTEGDKLVVVGGDGTLNRFVNAIEDKEYPFPIYCYAGGTGNDFIHDVVGGPSDEPLLINKYIHALPEVEVNGQTLRFINGIGYGIDGYCSEAGDIYRAKTGGKSPNYTAIALKGLFGAFKPVKAKVIIDGGEPITGENVWMVPAMNGRYFGGGMMITPDQDRLNEERDMTVAIVTAKSRIRLLTLFPKIFKGKHKGYTNVIKFYKCKSVTVEFDIPTALQVDGETFSGVTTYTAKSYALKKEKATV